MFGTTLRLKGAEFRYPASAENVLRGIDLEIRTGEWVAVLGSNGSGKSTLLKLFNALLVPTQGFCFVDEKQTSDVFAIDEIRAKVSLVFQNPEDQIVAAIVEEDTAFGPENLGFDSMEIQHRVERALRATGLWDKRRKPVSSLSGGQKQRLALAGVLAIGPKCLLLDEATSMLDPASRAEFMELVKEERTKGMTIVQVTHRLEEITAADRVVVLDQGQIIWDGSPQEFFVMPDDFFETMSFEKPAMVRFRDLLAKEGTVADTTLPDLDSMKEALCL